MTSFKFKSKPEVQFKQINSDYVDNFLKRVNHFMVSSSRVIAIQMDSESLDGEEKEILYNEGSLTPNYIYYWISLIFEIKKIALNKNYGAFWIDSLSKKYYDETIETTLELMINSLKWENNNPDIFFAWGNIDQHRIFKSTMNCAGVLIPCMEGLGLIAIINDDDYTILKDFFQ